MTKKIDKDIVNKIYKLENESGVKRTKYLRNLRLFEYSPTLSLQNMTDAQVCGYYQQGYFEQEDDTTSSIQENVIRSCIETLVSKIASQKVRPFFNTVNGSYKEMKIVKEAQKYFDNLYDEQNVNKTITDVFKDACIFDTGVIYIDIDKQRVERSFPWQVFIDSREYSYGEPKQAVRKQNQYPVTFLPFDVNENIDNVTLYEYWNLKDKKKYVYIPELDYFESETYKGEKIPFLFIHYSDPIKGSSCSSVVDQLYGIQMEIDNLMTKVKDASQLSSPLKFFVPEQSTIRVDKLSNRVGDVVTYTALPGMTGSPVTTATEPFMDPQWMTTIETLKQHAYELVGISQLSAMSKKPQGLNSGVALSTMEDIESDRFETQLNNVIRSYVDVARLCIDLFPPEIDILPPYRLRNEIKWADIIQAKDLMVVQFSAAESLSKDPSTKLQQLMQFQAAGLIPASRVAQLMELPDIDQGFSLAQNNINAIMSVIDDCIEKDVYDIPDYVLTEQLQQEIINTCLSLRANNSNGHNDGDIKKLTTLFEMAEKKKVDAMTSAEMASMTQLAQEMQNQIPQFDEQIKEGMQNADMQLDMEEALSQGDSIQKDYYTV